ncbi:MAG: dTDP-4-dehydrorhamnose 3,5-epimerase [Pseudanabaenaceae cyanobacterium bins.68]|nr:dTDP-4-dehydrorhamnose 3,5-epimerase [Pseudanabaenaceae cyanobacterium bins.68]
MQIIPTSIPDLVILQPKIFSDQRGFFYESFNQKLFNQLTNTNYQFVQDNHSCSQQNVLRGLHYQIQQPQGKLVRVIAGAVLDVAVDLRRSSPSFGQAVTVELSVENRQMFWLPPGFAHGFLVLSKSAEFLYKTTDYYAPEFERTLLWNDPDLNLNWPIAQPLLSTKDQQGLPLHQAEVYE